MATQKSTPPAPHKPVYQFTANEYEREAQRALSIEKWGEFQAVTDAKSMVMGIQTLVNLLAWDDDKAIGVRDSDTPEDEVQPVLNDYHRATITKFLDVSLSAYIGQLERRVDYLAEGARNV